MLLSELKPNHDYAKEGKYLILSLRKKKGFEKISSLKYRLHGLIITLEKKWNGSLYENISQVLTGKKSIQTVNWKTFTHK